MKSDPLPLGKGKQAIEHPTLTTIRWLLYCLVIVVFGFHVWHIALAPICLHRREDFEIQPEYTETFQIYQKPLQDGHMCGTTIMHHSFGFSYGKPWSGHYNPPVACGLDFSRVVLNLTTTCKGVQFDRIGFISLHDVEIWRTSTFEPAHNGTYSNYVKDVTDYTVLFQHAGPLTMELGNLVNEHFTGIFNVTLSLTFYYTSRYQDRADLVLPINTESNIIMPRNAHRAVVKVFASGNAEEEFWYTNVPNEYTGLFGADLYGESSFREVRLLIDEKLAGVVWPYPVIFTGGIVPGLWRPIVAIDAYDLKPHEINISPFIGLLGDGRRHRIRLEVHGQNARIKSWYIGGSIHIWIDEDVAHTSGEMLSYTNNFSMDIGGNVEEGTASIFTRAQRYLEASGRVNTSWGSQVRTWAQDLSFSNTQLLATSGRLQNITQNTIGRDESLLDGNYVGDGYALSYEYPFALNYTFMPRKQDFIFDASIDHGKHVYRKLPLYVWPLNEYVSTNQSGQARYVRRYEEKSGRTWGETRQEYQEHRRYEDKYMHNARAINGSVVNPLGANAAGSGVDVVDGRFLARFIS